MIKKISETKMEEIERIKLERIAEIRKFINETDLENLHPNCITSIYSGVKHAKSIANRETKIATKYVII